MCIHIYRVFLGQLSVGGHFSCCHVLAVVNSAAVNIGGACIFSNYSSFFPEIYPGVGLLGRMVVLFLVFFFS